MGYEVLVEELRRAADRMRTVTEPLAGYDFHSSNVTGEAFGHVELAAWFQAVADQCDNAGAALRSGAEELADQLDYAAQTYEQTDQGVAGWFGQPMGGLGGPGRPGRPGFLGTPGSTP